MAQKCFPIDPRVAKLLHEKLHRVRAKGRNYFPVGDGEQRIGMFVDVDAFHVLLQIARELDDPRMAEKLLELLEADGGGGKTVSREQAFRRAAHRKAVREEVAAK